MGSFSVSASTIIRSHPVSPVARSPVASCTCIAVTRIALSDSHHPSRERAGSVARSRSAHHPSRESEGSLSLSLSPSLAPSLLPSLPPSLALSLSDSLIRVVLRTLTSALTGAEEQ